MTRSVTSSNGRGTRVKREPGGAARRAKTAGIQKCPTGIAGLDQITGGGLPRGRPTLVCGTAGCGKTLMAMEFLARGAMESRRRAR